MTLKEYLFENVNNLKTVNAFYVFEKLQDKWLLIFIESGKYFDLFSLCKKHKKYMSYYIYDLDFDREKNIIYIKISYGLE